MLQRALSGSGGASGCRVVVDGVEVPFSNPLATSGCVQCTIVGLKSQGNFTTVTFNINGPEYIRYKLHNGIDADVSDYNHLAPLGANIYSQASGLDTVTISDDEKKAWGANIISNITFS